MKASAKLASLRAETAGQALSFGSLTARIGDDAAGFLILFLSVPFVHPFPMGGLSTPAGVIVAAIGFRIAAGRHGPAVPAFAGRKIISAAALKRMLTSAERLLSLTERFARPRSGLSRRAAGAFAGVGGMMLASPFYLPLGNTSCAVPLALLGLSIAEDDGLLAAVGAAGVILSIAYHVAALFWLWRAAAAR